jgi:hypothetical protein
MIVSTTIEMNRMSRKLVSASTLGAAERGQRAVGCAAAAALTTSVNTDVSAGADERGSGREHRGRWPSGR